MKRFTYGSAYLYEQIRKMHELQEEYLLVVNYDVKSFGDLYRLKFRLENVDEELCKVQKELYRDRASQKRSCKTTEDMAFFEKSENDYQDRLEQIKMQKKDNHKKLKAVERCLERDGSLKGAELELRVPVDELGDIKEMYKVEVPENPYQVQEDVTVSEVVADDVVETDVVDVVARDVADIGGGYDVGTVENHAVEGVVSSYELVSDRLDELLSTVEDVEPDLKQDDFQEYEEMVRLPSNKDEYMGMSVAEKVCCYLFDIEGTDSTFEMVKAYFETVGLDTDSHTVYEEAKLLTDYYEEQRTKEFIQERTERIIGTMELLGIDAGRITEYSTDVLSEVFGFWDMEYFAGIKLFNKVIDRLGADMNQQGRYELFDRIYEEGMREKKVERDRNSR